MCKQVLAPFLPGAGFSPLPTQEAKTSLSSSEVCSYIHDKFRPFMNFLFPSGKEEEEERRELSSTPLFFPSYPSCLRLSRVLSAGSLNNFFYKKSCLYLCLRSFFRISSVQKYIRSKIVLCQIYVLFDLVWPSS